MTVRKNFLFDEDIAEHLKKIAKKANITQTQVVKNLIEAEYEEYSVNEKLEALYSFAGTMNGLIGDDVSTQSIKMEMGSKI